jgi:Tfp pilus assembly protein PilO
MSPKRYFFILLGIMGGIIALAGGGYYYALITVKATSLKLAAQQGEQNAADDELQYLSRLKVQYTHDIEPILPVLEQALPRTKNQTEILTQLQTISQESGLHIAGATFASAQGLPTATSQTVQSGKVLALPITFQVSGSYAQLQNFLTKVETLSRFTNVTTLSISRPDKTKPIIYAMTVNAYVKP